jgi:polygalacturonase
MKLIFRIVIMGLVSLDMAVAFQGVASAATTISVATYGAKCDGVTNDTAAIQSALNSAAAAGGGTVILPGSTCLLNSFTPSSHAAAFYNLHVPSGSRCGA